MLDKAKFVELVNTLAVRVPAKMCSVFLQDKTLRGLLLNRPSQQCVLKDPVDPSARLILLSESIGDVAEHDALRAAVDRCALGPPSLYKLVLDFDQLSYDSIIRKIVPEGLDLPSSFETVGHIAHLNLKDELLPYKFQIGQLVMEKNKQIRTVVNKLGSIHNEFRVFDMEVIAGVEQFHTVVKEHGCLFKLNFKQVYWNSRLSSEHQRVVHDLAPDSVVCDMFCGIGPFAIPAAKRGVRVLANDLNPRSAEFLKDNIRLNHVEHLVTPFNMDARDFVRHCRAEELAGRLPRPTHYLMNLPASAIEFLDVFPGLLDGVGPAPTIYCYCFGPLDAAGVLEAAEAALGQRLAGQHTIRKVRLVAPTKIMYCVIFPLPRAKRALEPAGPSPKKPCPST